MSDEHGAQDEEQPEVDDTTQTTAAGAGVPVGADAGAVESLQAALKALREEADAVAGMKNEERVEAAEQVVEHAAELDRELGELARGNPGEEG
jgi:hypothetical protein